ncbi:MAG: ABC transporter substrate-binding protein [Solirubrobacteraceae bacterium]
MRRSLVAAVLVGGAALVMTAGSAGAASPPGLLGTLPSAGTPSKGGTITIGFLTGATPLTIFPITGDAQSSVYTTFGFQYDFFVPLYNGPVGATQEIDYATSLGQKPTFSNGDKTVTIKLNQGYKWANGQPVVGNDLVFDIDLMKAAVKENPANLSSYSPGLFPANVASVSAPSKYTVVIHLTRGFNPGYFLNDELESEDGVVPLPSTAWNIAKTGGPHLDYTVPANAKKIYDYLEKLGSSLATFGSNPLWKIDDGPFILKTFNTTNSSWTATPNPEYGGSPKPSISELEGVTFTSQTAELNAIKSGAVDISTPLDPSYVPQAATIRAAGYSFYGYPDLGFFDAIFNFKDKTDHFNSIISQLYIRQALQYLENQPAYVKGIYKGAAVTAYGPVPSRPSTAYTPTDAVTPLYPYNPAKAVALLKSHGWNVVPGGQTTCAKAGTGAGECGAGIPKGTPFKFVWVYIPASQAPIAPLTSEAFGSEAKTAAGIDITFSVKTFNFAFANYNDATPAGAKYVDDWGVNDFGGFTDDYYPTTNSIFNIGGTYNQGAFDDPTANSLIHDSVYGTNPNAVTAEAAYLAKTIPAIFMPNQDLLIAVNNKVGGPADSFLALTAYQTYPQYWYIKK